jgi:hypothetical protein
MFEEKNNNQNTNIKNANSNIKRPKKRNIMNKSLLNVSEKKQ